jgi:hypothetical protein
VWLSNLRPHDNERAKDKVVFDKFYSKGDLKERRKIKGVLDTIEDKKTKVEYKPDHIF